MRPERVSLEAGALARRAGGIIARPQDTVLVVDEGKNLLLVRPMVLPGW